MSITRIYNTELNQGVNELNTIRQAIAGKWGNDSIGNTYTGNLLHGLVTSGNTIKNPGNESGSLVIVCFSDDTYTIAALAKDESRAFNKQIKMAIQIGINNI